MQWTPGLPQVRVPMVFPVLAAVVTAAIHSHTYAGGMTNINTTIQESFIVPVKNPPGLSKVRLVSFEYHTIVV